MAFLFSIKKTIKLHYPRIHFYSLWLPHACFRISWINYIRNIKIDAPPSLCKTIPFIHTFFKVLPHLFLIFLQLYYFTSKNEFLRKLLISSNESRRLNNGNMINILSNWIHFQNKDPCNMTYIYWLSWLKFLKCIPINLIKKTIWTEKKSR